MRKVLSLVLVLTLVLGSMSMAFAAPKFSDVNDEDVLEAVERLNAFGIVDGYEDGSYKPERDVTRAEFSKFIVTALGLGDAAQAAGSNGKFSDVEANAWFAGYVSVAEGQGLLKGYPDGTFRPNKTVSYAEAVTMLVRALGYKDEFLPGSWPGNYVAKAASEGVTKHVKFLPGNVANRGAVALMVNNTLDADIVDVSSYSKDIFGGGDDSILYRKLDKTLLSDKLDVKKLEEAIVVATPKVEKTIDEDQIRVELQKDYEEEDVTIYDEGDIQTFDVTENVNMENLLGLSLNVYINDDDEVVYVEESAKPFKVLYDVIDEDEDIDVEGDGITLINVDKEYEFEEDAQLYIDNESVSEKTFEEEAGEGNLFVKAVLSNKGNIKVIDAFKWEDQALVVTESDDDEITYFINSEEDDKKIQAEDYDKVVVMDIEGNTMSMEDVKKDDVIYVNDQNLDGKDLEEAAGGDEVAYIFVVRNSFEDKAESHDSEEFELVDGGFYDVNRLTTVSLDQDDSISLYSDSGSERDDLTGEEAEVVVLLDITGDVRHIRGGIESSSDDMFGVITGKDEKYDDLYVKILNSQEEEEEYEFDLDKVYGYDAKDSDKDAFNDFDDVKKGDLVRYVLDQDGDIEEIQLIARANTSAPYATTVSEDSDVKYEFKSGEADKDIEEESIYINGQYHAVDKSVVVFDYEEGAHDQDYGDVETVKWEDLVDKTAKGSKAIAVLDKYDEVVMVAFIEGFDIISDDTYAGYVQKITEKDGDYFAYIINEDGEEVKYQFEDEDEADKATEETPIAFEVKSNNKIVVLERNDSNFDDEFDMYTGKVTNVKGSYVTIWDGDEEQKVKTNNSTIYFEEDTKEDSNDLSEDDYVTVLEYKGIAATVRLYDTTKEKVADKDGSEAKLFLDYVAKNESSTTWAEPTGEVVTDSPTIDGGEVQAVDKDQNLVVIDGKDYEYMTLTDEVMEELVANSDNVKVEFKVSSTDKIYGIKGMEITGDADFTNGGATTIDADVVVKDNGSDKITVTNLDLGSNKLYQETEKLELVNVTADVIDVNASGTNTLTIDSGSDIETVNVNKAHRVVVDGTVTTLNVKTSGVILQGSGTITDLKVSSDSYDPKVSTDLNILKTNEAAPKFESARVTVADAVYTVEVTMNEDIVVGSDINDSDATNVKIEDNSNKIEFQVDPANEDAVVTVDVVEGAVKDADSIDKDSTDYQISNAPFTVEVKFVDGEWKADKK